VTIPSSSSNFRYRSTRGLQFTFSNSGWIPSGPAALFVLKPLIADSISDRSGSGLGSAAIAGKLLSTDGSGRIVEFNLLSKCSFHLVRIPSVVWIWLPSSSRRVQAFSPFFWLVPSLACT
jgi:hypothetical protein